MEVTSVKELKQALSNDEVKLRRADRHACVYYPEARCEAPRMRFGICRTCPRCASSSNKQIVRDLFNRIKALAIMLMRQMGKISK